jgi:hypothetical protein
VATNPRGRAVRDLPDSIAGVQGGKSKMKNAFDTLIRSMGSMNRV